MSANSNVQHEPVPFEMLQEIDRLMERGTSAYPGAGVIFDPVVALRPEMIFIAPRSRIDTFVKLEGGSGLYIGTDVHIASFCHIGIGGGLVLLEDGSSFGSGAKVLSGSNVYGHGLSCSAIAANSKIVKSFSWIGKDAVIFAGAIVLPGRKVGQGAVVAAGAVCRHDVPDFEVWGGVDKFRKIGEVNPDDTADLDLHDGKTVVIARSPDDVPTPVLPTKVESLLPSKSSDLSPNEEKTAGGMSEYSRQIDELYGRSGAR